MALGGLLPDTPVVSVLLILGATAVIWLGSGWLEESAEHLSAYYGLPTVVQGSVVVAIGSSFPELASVVFTALAGTFDMGVDAIVDSAIFNILVIPAVAGIFADGEMETNRTIVYKEAQFYMVAVATLVLTFALGVIYAPVPGAHELVGSLTRPLAALPLLLYVFIQWQDVSDHTAESVDIPVGREWLRLLGSLAPILVAVEQLVGDIESLSHTFGIPAFLAGVTIIAAATSLPDLLVSVRSARAGKSVTSLGNVLGSNTFDLLVAIPLGVPIVGTVTVDFAVPMFGVLTLATVLLFAIMRTDLSLTSVEPYALLVAYAAFVAWVVAETAGVTHIIKSA